MDDDQAGGAQGGYPLQQPTAQGVNPANLVPIPIAQQPVAPFGNWPGLNARSSTTQTTAGQLALPPPSSMYTGQFLSQSTR